MWGRGITLYSSVSRLNIRLGFHPWNGSVGETFIGTITFLLNNEDLMAFDNLMRGNSKKSLEYFTSKGNHIVVFILLERYFFKFHKLVLDGWSWYFN